MIIVTQAAEPRTAIAAAARRAVRADGRRNRRPESFVICCAPQNGGGWVLIGACGRHGPGCHSARPVVLAHNPSEPPAGFGRAGPDHAQITEGFR
ncbi:hypothetical protein Prum_087220 [Phytohabitans rumicis]|uniref:Uncharacterized protein n=1 Tax=Phytohabitans rumicis TaxID=1076125 RepID=A0A6V8LHK0_9ACTN|nr:hypothetical protein Prum_087220 [Phytohabitans rumicis]